MSPETIAEMMVQTLCSSSWSERSLKLRLRRTLGKAVTDKKWLDGFIARLIEREGELWPLCNDPDAFKQYVIRDPDFVAAVVLGVQIDYRFDATKLPPLEMTPASVATGWDVPAITTSRDLADWFALSISQLDWLADCRGLERFASREKLRNYRYRWIEKPSGGRRLVESPKARLKSVQRQILDGILSRIPVHSAAHAFRSGRSVQTFATPHVGRDVVMRIDLRDFFPSIRASRVHGVFRTAGYPDQVTRLLTGLCTNRTWRSAVGPRVDSVFDHRTSRRERRHRRCCRTCARGTWIVD